MTPVERLHAAIDKLERLKVDGSPGPWRVWTDKLSFDVEVRGPDGLVARLWAWFGPAVRQHADATLIVTLHRTIDAQLIVLRTALIVPTDLMTPIERPYWDAALALADAILGGDS